jgi:hypothetical protein
MKNNFTAILLSAIACLVSLANAAPAEAQPTKLASPKSSATQTQSQPAKNKFDLTFDDLKFEMEKGSPFNRKLLTPKINGYHNSTVKLRGYIRPSFTQSGLSKFIFVRDNKECCFGPGAAIFDCVLVRLEAGLETEFTVRPISIEGNFSLKEYKGPDGNVWSIYRMTNAKVK